MKPQRVHVFLNPASGRPGGDDDKVRTALEAAFDRHGISTGFAFLKGGDLRAGVERALRGATRGGLDAVVVGGGDGTIGTAAGVLADTGVPLGILPMGTLNHFAKDLGIPLALDEAVAVIAAGEERPVDVGEVNGRVFINNSSIGIYPYLVLDRERRTGRDRLPKWLAMILAGARALKYFPLRRLSLRTPTRAEVFRSPGVLVGNNAYQISGSSMGSRERLDEGTLAVYVTRQRSRVALLWLAFRSIAGLLDQQRDLRALKLPEVEITSGHRRLMVSFDGEVDAVRGPLRYRIRPGALRVFFPHPDG